MYGPDTPHGYHHLTLGLNFEHTVYVGDAGPKGRKIMQEDRPKGVPFVEIDRWCEQQFGPVAVTGRYRDRVVHHDRNWYRSGYKVFFRRSEDAFAFKMRWG